jgi:DNA-binding IclR family transcriptional regulator
MDPGEWWTVVDAEILDCLKCHGAMTPSEISRELGISEGEATVLLTMLAREGRVRIERVQLAA